jgi:myosin protein heavy chain
VQNLQAALTAAHGKVKDNSLETRNLQATLEKISHTSDEHKARGDRLEREKSMLDARVKELETQLRQTPKHLPTTTPNRREISRPRSSSLSNFRLSTLEQDLIEARTSLATKDTELRTLHQKLSQVENDLITVDNEKSAMEKKFKAEVGELQAILEEKEEELCYLKELQGDTGREEDLLRRIDEDDAKIEALEMMLRGTEDSKQLKEKLQRVEGQVCRERKHIAELEDRQIQLVREKEEALDELEEARRNIDGLKQKLSDRDIRDHDINER